MLNRDIYIKMFREQKKEHGDRSLYPFCVGVIEATVKEVSKPEEFKSGITEILAAFEKVKSEK